MKVDRMWLTMQIRIFRIPLRAVKLKMAIRKQWKDLHGIPLALLKRPKTLMEGIKLADAIDEPVQAIAMKGRIILYTRFRMPGLQDARAWMSLGKLDEKIDYLVNEAPSFEAPLPPLSGEDDVSNSGAIDELA
ncbi:hypothetical protein M0R45_027655 [Rubus argutus]|uniref:Uncharacterized protein n=1 Tax=Rubus argutus TaxID=59490 RepID=A0AAW1X2T8_RUBAR